MKRHSPEAFSIFGVNTDSDQKEYRREAEDLGVDWPNIFCGSTDAQIVKDWGVQGFPTTFVIDQNGLIVAKGLRGKQQEALVDKLVKELQSKSKLDK